MTKTTFNFIDRKYEKTLVLIPGWAADHRIFNELNLPYNYLMPVVFSPFNFNEALDMARVEHGLTKISLFGWSMGGFVAAHYAALSPERIEHLILVSVRRQYDPAVCEHLKEVLTKNRRGYMHQFTAQCFYDKDRFRLFQNILLRIYLKELPLEFLHEGLDYLAQVRIKPEDLKNVQRITIVHGKEDLIAPLEEARAIAAQLPQAQLILLDHAGHIPFLEKNFNEINFL